MDYLATVRDGSTGELVSGYWLVEIVRLGVAYPKSSTDPSYSTSR